MKFREGFISNSSSTSFVIIGYKLNREIADQLETENEYGIDVLEGKLQHISDNLRVIEVDSDLYVGFGRRIYDDNDVNSIEYDQSEISHILKLLASDLNVDSVPSIYYGFIYD